MCQPLHDCGLDLCRHQELPLYKICQHTCITLQYNKAPLCRGICITLHVLHYITMSLHYRHVLPDRHVLNVVADSCRNRPFGHPGITSSYTRPGASKSHPKMDKKCCSIYRRVRAPDPVFPIGIKLMIFSIRSV